MFNSARIQGQRPGALLVFFAFDAAMKRGRAAGDESLDKLGRCAKCWRNFSRIENSDASAAPSTNIKQAAAIAEGCGDDFNRPSEIDSCFSQCVVNKFFLLDKELD